jgi:hypothetical protein
MRLTLRTLLAYLDNMLDPADAEALKSKIDESEFAKILVARLENVVRQPRLSSLPLDEKGLGLDANSIAQYLDNTLPPELVPELEQFLLQSDMQLAEVAACHQVLASILETEPIVSPELKHRVRCIGSPKEIMQGTVAAPKGGNYFQALESATSQPHSHSPVLASSGFSATNPPISKSATAAASSGPLSMSDSIVLTDPLRPAKSDWTNSTNEDPSPARKNRGLRTLITLALIALLVITTVQAIGPLNRLQNLWTTTALAPETGEETPSTSADSVGGGNVRQPSDSPESSSENNSAAETNSEKMETAAVNPTPAATEETADVDRGAVDPNGEPMTEKGNAEKSLTPSQDSVSDTPTSAPSSPTNKKNNLPLINVQVASWNPPTDLPQTHLLFALDEVNHQVIRVTTATSLAHGTNLLLAPGTRNSINVNYHVDWKFYSAADCRVTTHAESPWLTTVELKQGKAVLQDSGKSNFVDRQPQTLIRNGTTLVWLRWSEPNSAVAVEAIPQWLDASQADSRLVGPLAPLTDLRISVLQGKVEFGTTTWNENIDGTMFESNPGSVQKLGVGDSWTRRGEGPWESAKIESTPAWIETPIERPIDRQAASDLMQILPAGARANLVLGETLKNRRPEVACLAAQVLILADDFSFLAGPTGMLNDERFRSHWTVLIDAVRDRISTSEKSYEALKSSLAAQDVQRGSLLFQILVGYSAPELKLNAAERLVNLLESEFLDERVLAIYQLKRITGKDLGFQPDRPSKGILQDWKRLWRSGGIPPK